MAKGALGSMNKKIDEDDEEAKAQAEEAAFLREAKRLSKETGNNGHKLLAHELEGIRRAINAQSRNVGKHISLQTTALRDGLAAIALAASTPEDNSEEVKALTARTKAVADTLEGAAESAKQT